MARWTVIKLSLFAVPMDRIHRENENSERRDVCAPPESGDADTGRFHPYGKTVVGGMEKHAGQDRPCHHGDPGKNHSQQRCRRDAEQRLRGVDVRRTVQGGDRCGAGRTAAFARYLSRDVATNVRRETTNSPPFSQARPRISGYFRESAKIHVGPRVVAMNGSVTLSGFAGDRPYM